MSCCAVGPPRRTRVLADARQTELESRPREAVPGPGGSQPRPADVPRPCDMTNEDEQLGKRYVDTRFDPSAPCPQFIYSEGAEPADDDPADDDMRRSSPYRRKKDCFCPAEAKLETRRRMPNEDDCKCEIKGSCKHKGKKVRFVDETELEPESRRAAGDTGRIEPGYPGRPAGLRRREDHDCRTHRDRDRYNAPGDELVLRKGAECSSPCDCPCYAAFNPAPPATLATADIYRTCGLPKRFNHPGWFSGYNAGPKHPLYRTTSSDVGRYAPNVHTVTTVYRPSDRSWSNVYYEPGPWRNYSLVTTGSIWDVYRYNDFY